MTPFAPPTAEPETIGALQAVAARVLDAQRDAMTAIGDIELAHLGALPELARMRALVAVTLFKASCDFGLAASTLLAANLADFVAPALALHRTQFETWARGIFFKSAASDDEIRRFVRDDTMPKRLRSNGKRSTITAAEVLREAARAEGMDAAKLQSVMDDVWNSLCGIVHGGRPLLQTYRAIEAIGANVNAWSIWALLSNIGAHTVLAATGICAIADNGTDQQEVLTRIKASADAITAAVDLPAPALRQ